MADMEAAG